MKILTHFVSGNFSVKMMLYQPHCLSPNYYFVYHTCKWLLSQSIKSDRELGAEVSSFNSTAEIELSPQVFQ